MLTSEISTRFSTSENEKYTDVKDAYPQCIVSEVLTFNAQL